jgi:hypothetical protein
VIHSTSIQLPHFTDVIHFSFESMQSAVELR